MCRTLMEAGFDTLPKMEAATEAEIAAIPRVGSSKAHEFVKGLVKRVDIIDHLLIAGITIKAPSQGAFKGQSFCFTGVRRGDLERAIEDQGGILKSSVGKTLTYLVAADPNSTSGKAKKARGYGVKVISESDAETLLGV